MKSQVLLVVLIAGLVVLNSLGSVLAQDDDCTEEDCEDCTSCRTNNFYYVLIAAIIIFVIFFYWTNRHKVPKKPAEPDEKPGKEAP